MTKFYAMNSRALNDPITFHNWSSSQTCVYVHRGKTQPISESFNRYQSVIGHEYLFNNSSLSFADMTVCDISFLTFCQLGLLFVGISFKLIYINADDASWSSFSYSKSIWMRIEEWKSIILQWTNETKSIPQLLIIVK